MALITNREKKKGTIHEIIRGSDIFIGVSKGNLLTAEDVKSMNEKAIVFAMANPVPEIMPEEAIKGGALIIATGRSDFNNQVNNVLAFPGIFRGALDVRATRITDEMKIAAAEALASAVEKSSFDMIIPNPLDKSVTLRVAEAVKKAWLKAH